MTIGIYFYKGRLAFNILYDILLQVFVNEGNIYYQPNPGAKAERITNGGGDYRLYGISDWLYEGTSYHS